MPKGLKRWYGGGDLHYITCSCYQRQAFLSSAARRDLFLKIFEQVRQKYEIQVVGYVVMPEHFHLLIGEPDDGNVSLVMQVLKQRVSRQCRARGRGHSSDDSAPPAFWHTRSYDFNVFTMKKVLEKLDYYSLESGEARTGYISGAVAVEQLPLLRSGRRGTGKDRR